MALNYDVTRCDPPVSDAEWENNHVFGVCSTLLAVGMTRIENSDDALEVTARYSLYVRMTGAPIWVNSDGTAKYPDFGRWIGLSTNVSAESRKAWLARIGEYELDKMTRETKVRW